MRVIISILMFLSISEGLTQTKILTFSTGRSGGTANLYFDLHNKGYKKVNVLAKEFDPQFINFGLSSKIFKFIYFSTKIELDRMNGNFLLQNSSPSQNEFSLVSFNWSNVGLSLSVAPEFRYVRKYFHFYVNAGLNQRIELVNLNLNSEGRMGSSIEDLSGKSVTNNIKYSAHVNSGVNLVYKNIALNLELGYRRIPRSSLIPDILFYKVNTLIALTGISYSF